MLDKTPPSKLSDWRMRLYWRLPVGLQERALSLYARRLNQLYYGGGFAAACCEVRTNQWCSQQAIAAWQMSRFRELLRHAVRAPYYRELLSRTGIDAFRTIDDLSRLPLLGRQSVRQHELEFIDDGADPAEMFQEKTSGSTGTSVTVYWPTEALRRMQAVFEVRVRNVAGVSRLVPRAMLGGRPIVAGNADRAPFWRYNRFWKQLYLSSYHVSRRTAASYIGAIRASGVEWLTGYGSAIAALADSAMAESVPPLRMRTVVVSGDTLQPSMRLSIESFFECKCYDMYGSAEAVAMGMECPAGRMHLVPEAGIVEIIGDNDVPCEPGTVGEIVATGLINDGMPLIRYRTGDWAALSKDQNCACGSNHAIIESLEGRVDDYLVTIDGRQIGRLSTALKRSPRIHSAQIVQTRPGHAHLVVRPGDGYRSEDAAAVCADIVERIGEFDLEVREVAEIPKTPSGKARLVVRLAERPELWETYGPLLGIPHRLSKSPLEASRPASASGASSPPSV